MKKSFESVLLATLTVLMLCNPTYAQDFQSPYFNKTPLDPIDDLSIVVNTNIGTYVEWYRPQPLPTYTGEYEVYLKPDWFFWNNYSTNVPAAQSLFISYDMEIVSFPFTPDCYLNPAGCAGQPNRNFIMPTNATPYSNDRWGPLYHDHSLTILTEEHYTTLLTSKNESLPIRLLN